MKIYSFIILLLILCETSFAQIPVMPVAPGPSTFQRHDINQYSGHSNPSPPIPSIHISPNRQQMDMYQQDMMEMKRRNQANQELNRAYDPFQRKMIADDLITNGFPSLMKSPGTEHFLSAFDELRNMLSGAAPIDLCRAIYLVENAYYGGTQDYKEFQQQLDKRVRLCNWRLQELKLNPKDNLSLNMVIYNVLCDTLNIKQPGTETTITSFPLKYNVDDYASQKDYTSHFVTTLMKSNIGQCYSMPLLYMMIAEKLGAEAHLSYAPHHSFIKIQDKKGAWYNLELTCGYILSDNHYMNHSYIKSEAIRSGIYLNPLTQKELIASLAAQLGGYYEDKYGSDPFTLECADISEKYFPNCIQALMLKSNYQTRLTLTIARLLEARNPEILKEKSPEAYKHYEKMQQIYKEMDDSGYEETPPEVYERWHNHVLAEKEKNENP